MKGCAMNIRIGITMMRAMIEKRISSDQLFASFCGGGLGGVVSSGKTIDVGSSLKGDEENKFIGNVLLLYGRELETQIFSPPLN